MAPAELYDDDDLYDGDEYEEGQDDELSSEDKAAMETGTADVKKALGADASKVTTKQIQEALWHYYYDVDKSVAYLSKTFIAPPPPKPTPQKAPESKSNEFSFYSSLDGLFVKSSGAENELAWPSSPQIPEALPAPYISFGGASNSTAFQSKFNDMPWLNIPKNRQAWLIAPIQPRGGLLGGAGEAPRMSKLQALAAARKKKNDEKKEQAKTSQTESGMKRLSIADDGSKENSRGVSTSVKRQRGPNVQVLAQATYEQGNSRSGTAQNQRSVPAHAETVSLQKSSEPEKSLSAQGEDQFAAAVPKSAPSAFAKTLFPSAPDVRHINRPGFYAMPYASSSSFLGTAFSEPSPDDIVLAAQAKGSIFAREK
jgi:elongation factor 1 alpha-like protein